MTSPHFPHFRTLVDEYLAARHGLGFDGDGPRWVLTSFARYADRIGHRGPITADLAIEWALATRSRDPVCATRRLAVVRPFVRYCQVLDPATEIPPSLGRLPRRTPPHIYTEPEIAALLKQAALLLPLRGLRPQTYVTLFSLLASTGLRVSEACRLKPHDVDLVEGVLTVRASKFRKSRFVPLHPTATLALTQYAAHRDRRRTTPPSSGFFQTDHVAVLTRAAVEKTFSRIRQRLAWSTEGRTRRPRIHDLRHSFAVRRLLSWSTEGIDVNRQILALATYLGHAKVSDTYWYLSAVPELMAVTAQRFETFVREQEVIS
jgi:integrase